MSDKFEEISLEEASRAQVAMFAAIYGLDVDGRAGKDAIIMELQNAGYQRDTIRVAKVADRDHGLAVDMLARSQVNVWDGDDQYGIKRARRMIYINIPNQDRPGGDEAVAVGVNGVTMYIARNTPSLVPEEYIESLSHALETRFEPSQDPQQSLSRPRVVQRYPFQVIPIPDESVIANAHGKPYEPCSPSDVKEYKAKLAAKETELAEAQRERLRQKGLLV